MDYYKAVFHPPSGSSEMLVAFLGDEGFEMFEELPDAIAAYIPAVELSEEEVRSRISGLEVTFTGSDWTLELIPDRNWNEEWERSFQPVRIGEKVIIRAPFHQVEVPADFIEIIIEPKMSFGTGHHATTSLMVEAMLSHSFGGTAVLDMGCGSGVLAILAERLGATKVYAVDIDDWAVSNTLENIQTNACSRISVEKGNASLLAGKCFDVVLANINRNILLLDMAAYASVLNQGGQLFVSGFLQDDIKVLQSAAEREGLALAKELRKDNWSQITFEK